MPFVILGETTLPKVTGECKKTRRMCDAVYNVSDVKHKFEE